MSTSSASTKSPDITFEVITPEDQITIVQARLRDAEMQYYSLTVQQAANSLGVNDNQVSAQATVVTTLQKMYADAQAAQKSEAASTGTPAASGPAA